MGYIVQQRDIDLLKQSKKDLKIRLELLDSSYKILDVLQGVLTTDSYTIDADSDVRRTYNCTFYIQDSSLLVGDHKKYGQIKLLDHISV